MNMCMHTYILGSLQSSRISYSKVFSVIPPHTLSSSLTSQPPTPLHPPCSTILFSSFRLSVFLCFFAPHFMTLTDFLTSISTPKQSQYLVSNAASTHEKLHVFLALLYLSYLTLDDYLQFHSCVISRNRVLSSSFRW